LTIFLLLNDTFILLNRTVKSAKVVLILSKTCKLYCHAVCKKMM